VRAITERLKATFMFLRSIGASVPQTSRSLRRAPGFVAIATLSLGVALGLSTSVFALIDAMTHPNSPYSHVEQLFEVRLFGGSRIRPSSRDLLDALAAIPGVDRVSEASMSYRDVETNESVPNAMISRPSHGFFELLGVHPRIGRLPTQREEERQSAAVVSDDFWKSQFHNRRDIGDAHVIVGGLTYDVVGVLPPRANAPSYTSVWIPALTDTSSGFGFPVMRLRSNARQTEVQSRLNAIMERLTRIYAKPDDKPFAAGLWSLRPDPLALKDFHRAMIGAALCVLLIACANVAALMLARGTVRQRDYALRLALGASRGDIAREVMFEIAALAMIGAIAGAVIATWTVGLMTHATPVEMRWMGFATPQWSIRVLAMSALSMVIAVALAGGIPAWQASRTDPAGTLKESSGGNTGRSGTRFRWLVMTELALSMTLLVGASLMVKSVGLMAKYDFGFDAQDMISANVYMYNRGIDLTGAQIAGRFREALERIRGVPGVESAAMTSKCQFANPVLTTDRTIEGGSAATMPQCTNVSTDYFRTLGYTFAEGRDFSPGDALGDGAVVLDEKTARKLFPHESAVGRMVKLGNLSSKKPWLTVVGVVHNKLAAFEPFPERGTDSSEVMFVTMADSTLDARDFPVRITPGVRKVAVEITRALRGALPPRSTIALMPFTHTYNDQLGEERFLALTFSLLGVASLLLGAAGLFSVVSYVANQRMREFAVRVALGATRENLARLVLTEALVMALGGTAIGAGLGMKAGFMIWDKMYGVYPVDAEALIVAEATLLIVTMIACLVPAMRAMRADPVTVLRAA
jgi:putative ABC transport system permease protein